MVIKESKLRSWAYIFHILICLGVTVLFYNICREEVKTNVLLIGLGICVLILLGKMFLYKEKTPLVIDENGISLDELNAISWSLIDYAYVHRVGSGKNSYNNFVVEYHDAKGIAQTTQVCLTGMSYSKKEIEAAVSYWSGRQIGLEEQKAYDNETDAKVNDGSLTAEEAEIAKRKAGEYLPLFKEESKTETTIIIVLFLISLIFRYHPIAEEIFNNKSLLCVGALVVGFESLVFVLGFIVAANVRSRFLKLDKIASLSEKERNEYFKFVDNDSNYKRSSLIGIIIAVIAFVVFAFTC